MFPVVADIREYSKVQPQIVDVQFLTPKQGGVGTRFRETRMMGGRRVSTELEVTEHVENQRVRLVAESGGTVWDTVFDLRPAGAGRTELTMVMDARAQNLLARLAAPLLMGMVRKGVQADIDRVKDHCEKQAHPAGIPPADRAG